jgi:hypothetical protein
MPATYGHDLSELLYFFNRYIYIINFFRFGIQVVNFFLLHILVYNILLETYGSD